MLEPRYDEDTVNLGYLKRALGLENEDTATLYKYISRHFGSKPQTPYYVGDTWVDGEIVWTCIKERLIGTYQDSDWRTESGAKEKASEKNKTYLRQPTDYDPGDMWILQSDDDHKAGKKGEILIATTGRTEYDEDDWVNMLGYGTIRSINEVANNIKDVLISLELNKEDGIETIYYSDTIPEDPAEDDLWYVTEDISIYSKQSVYKYDGENWIIVEDVLLTTALEEANEARLVSDGKIQAYYKDEEPTEEIGVGDIWIDTTNNKLHRYNGTKWVDVYDPKISEIKAELNTISERTTSIMTDLGSIQQEVSKKVSDVEDNILDLQRQILEITEDGTLFEHFSMGGKNLIRNSVGFFGMDFWEGTVVGYTDSEIRVNNQSDNAIFLQSNYASQSIADIKNGEYNLSFNYKKLISLASVSVTINGETYDLESEDWETFEKVITITDNNFDIRFDSDANNSCYISDLILTVGKAKQIWSQNPNETQTDTVQIGKGIQVNSSQKNTYARFDADGNRIINTATGQTVTELTDKGIRTDFIGPELDGNGERKVNSGEIGGVLIQQISGQTWFSSLL